MMMPAGALDTAVDRLTAIVDALDDDAARDALLDLAAMAADHRPTAAAGPHRRD